MLRIAKLIMQWGIFPPIIVNLNFPPWRNPPPRVVTLPPPKPAGFDPTRKVSNYEARIYAASNSLEERKS